MYKFRPFALLSLLTISANFYAFAANQTVPGKGNAAAKQLVGESPLVRAAVETLRNRLRSVSAKDIRAAMLELLDDRQTCIQHRANLSSADRAEILAKLRTEGLLQPSDGEAIQGGVEAGVFPPVEMDGSACPKPPQTFHSAPGGATGGHHAHPGGLPLHEVFNDSSALAFADNYTLVYGHSGKHGLSVVGPDPWAKAAKHQPRQAGADSAFHIDHDLILAAPIWHDWAKILVFQWNSDGTEFTELNFGGNGVSDKYGEPGDSKTGAHHILGLAEAIRRGLPADFVITVASAHAAPTNGDEYKIVNWLRTAAIIARVDPVASGYLHVDANGHLRLPALRHLADLNLLTAPGSHSNMLLEYVVHNLSDSDFGFTVPAAAESAWILAKLAPEFGYDPAAADYSMKFRYPVLAYLSAERIYIIYGNGGLDAVRLELNRLRKMSIL